MSALQLLCLGNLFKTDDAGIIYTRRQISRSVHIWKFLQLRYELPRLDKQLDRFPKSDKSVYDLAEKIQWKLLSRDDVHEKFDVEEQYDEIKDERDDVKHETLLCPLLAMIQLKQRDRVLEVVLDGFEEQSHEL